MKSAALGKNTSRVEVEVITRHGLWLHAKGRECFLPFSEYPWFKDAKISAVQNVHLLHQFHLYWPDLDVDLDLAAVEHPEYFPLIAKQGS